MSSNLSELFAQEMSDLYATSDCAFAIFTVLVYDWVLTLDGEIALFWRKGRRLSAASVIYALSRYMPILGSILTTVTLYPLPSLMSCKVIFWCQEVVGLVGWIVPAVFSATRVYALSGGKRLVSATIFSLSLVTAVINMIHTAKWYTPENLPSPFNCSVADTIPPSLSLRLVLITRGSAFVADILVVSLTWWYTYKTYRLQRGLQVGPSLIYSMFYYGNLYFVVIAFLNALQMVLSALELEILFGIGSYAEPFISPITSILICRFLLDLRQVNHDGPGTSQSTPSFVDLHFARSQPLPDFIASLGEPVHSSVTRSDYYGASDQDDDNGNDVQ